MFNSILWENEIPIPKLTNRGQSALTEESLLSSPWFTFAKSVRDKIDDDNYKFVIVKNFFSQELAADTKLSDDLKDIVMKSGKTKMIFQNRTAERVNDYKRLMAPYESMPAKEQHRIAPFTKKIDILARSIFHRAEYQKIKVYIKYYKSSE
jgi:hypothetical protein